MTQVEILKAFETEIGLINDSINKPLTEDSVYWLNQAISKFIKLRFNGDLVHKQGFEQTEKRREDLKCLIKDHTYTQFKYTSNTLYDSYYVEYQPDMLYIINESAVITDMKDNNPYSTSIFECTRDNFMYRITNSLTDFHYSFHKARPIRVIDANGCSLLTDRNYKVKEYTLGYIRKPKEINLSIDPTGEYQDFEDNVMYEIIKIAAQMYLENTKNERYKTISEEILTQE